VGKRATTRKELQAKAYLRELKAKLAEKDRVIAGITATNTAMSATVAQSQAALVEARAKIARLEADIATTKDQWRDRALAAEGALGRADLDRERAELDLQFADLRIRELEFDKRATGVPASSLMAVEMLVVRETKTIEAEQPASKVGPRGMQS
jgi:multidrug resistance efflux pump